MSTWLWLMCAALAQDPEPVEPEASEPPEAPSRAPVLELTGMGRRSHDVEVFVRYDGNLYYEDELVLASDLEPMLRERIAAMPDARVVITGDARAPYDALIKVMVLARACGAERTALEVLVPDLMLDELEGLDELFPGIGSADGSVTPLDQDGPTPEELRKLRPRRHELPQNPYANTNSFTAYALEWGETKVGLGSISTGVVPRLQVGTVPVLDALGALNANLKFNLIRRGPLDGALGLQYYYVPLSGLASGYLEAASADETAQGQPRDVSLSASYLGVGATGSLQILAPWSAHLQLYWGRPALKGDVTFDNLPEVLLPGQSVGGTGAVGLGAIGDLGVLNLATDLRFNRRDSVFAWLRYPFYGRVRGKTSGQIDGFDALSNAEVIVAYGDWIPFQDSYSLAIGYQASWKHFEARAGIGFSAVPAAWLLQAFELSYRFGGATRRQERLTRKGFRAMSAADG